jgi:hypothetical protein
MSGTARRRPAATDALDVAGNTVGLTLAATQTHGVAVTMPTLTAAACSLVAAGLLARVAASPMMPGALVLLEVSDRYRLLGHALANNIGMTPDVPDDER